MKILIVSNCPPLNHLGSGYVINHFVIGLKKLGYEVDFFDNRDYTICRWLNDRALIYRQSIGMLLLVKRILRRQTYDLIEFWGADAGLAMEFCKKNHPHTILVHHTNGPEIRYDPLMRYTKKWYHLDLFSYYKKSFTLADCILTVSEDDKAWLENHFPEKLIYSINPGLPPRFLNQKAKRPKHKLIGFAGSWIQRKGIDLIRYDITLVLQKHRDWKLRIIGGQKNKAILWEFPEDVRHQIELTPFLTDKARLISEYQEISIAIVPSIAESFGLVMAEAMACRAALVASKVGFANSLEHEKEAIILDKAEPGCLFSAIERLISSPGLMERIAENGWKRVQRLNWDTAYTQLKEIYQALDQRVILDDEKFPERTYLK